MDKLLVNLDLDETLIYTDLEDSLYRIERSLPDMFTDDLEAVYFRPGVVDFIRELLIDDNIEVGIYTAGLDYYALPILEELFGNTSLLSYIFFRDRCIQQYDTFGIYSLGGYRLIKDLKKVKRKTGFDMNRIVSIDDKMVYPRQCGNLILVPEYKGEKKDEILSNVLDDIIYLKDKNVRGNIINHKVIRN